MKNSTQQRMGVLALALLASAFSTTNVSADNSLSLTVRGLDLAEGSTQRDKAKGFDFSDQLKANKTQDCVDDINDITTLTLTGQESTFEWVVKKPCLRDTVLAKLASLGEEPTWYQRLSKKASGWFAKINPWAKSAGSAVYSGITDYAVPGAKFAGSSLHSGFTNYAVPGAKFAGSSLYNGFTDYVVPGAIEAGKVVGQALSDVAWQFSPQAVQDGYTRAHADTVAYQQQGYKPLSAFTLVTVLHPACWFGNQVFSENTKETSYINLHNLARLCGNGAIGGAEMASTSYHAGGKYSFVSVLGGGVAFVGLGLTGAGVSAIAQLGNKASKLGVYLPTPVIPQPQAAAAA